MSEAIQAKCPHCRNVLRIPADWLGQSMRCKHCQKTFQAKASTALKAEVAIARPAKPAAEVLLVVEEPTPLRRKRGNGSGLMVLVVMFFFLFLLGAAGASFVVYKALNMGPPDTKKIASADTPGKPINGPSTKKKDGDNADAAGVKDKDGAPPPTDVVLPKKDKKKFFPPKKDSLTKDGFKPGPGGSEVFPRRALLINVNTYLMFNPVHYGSGQDSIRGGYPGSSTNALARRLTLPPMNFPATQVFELSDGIPGDVKGGTKAHSTQKSVLETTIKDFLESSRAQDRVIVFFAGHGAYLDDEKQAYLLPIDANMKKPESLLPLKWVYEQLAKCKAQQKILVLDVFRYSPSRGFEYPSPGEGDEGTMPETFAKELENPPPGVLVWSSCIKEESAIELEAGSAFMQALCASAQGSTELGGISTPAQPIPIDNLVVKVNQKLKELTAPVKKTQTSRLTGKANGVEVAYDKTEALPAKLELKPPTAAGGKAANYAQVNSILAEIKRLQAVRETRTGDANLLKAQNLPAFPANKLDGYKADGYQNLAELHDKYKKAVASAVKSNADVDSFSKEFPLRGAYFAAVEALDQSSKLQMREVLASPVDPKRKAQFLNEQKPIGESIFLLKNVLGAMRDAEKQRDKETSKRWQANFDYTQARLQSRLIYLFEYNYTIAQIRNDALPDLAPGQNGWRVGTGKKIAVTEAEAKNYLKETKKLWTRIQNEYPDTPWALLAQRESLVSIGLSWRPKSD